MTITRNGPADHLPPGGGVRRRHTFHDPEVAKMAAVAAALDARMMAGTATAPAPTVTMQGIEIPAESVNDAAFFAGTRRMKVLQASNGAWAGFGQQELVPIRKSGILADLELTFVGSLTLTPGTGTIATTGRWPLDLLASCKLTANGQTNIINCPGSALRAREFMTRTDLTDKGVTATAGGASPGTSITSGSLKLASESWAPAGPGVTALAGGIYDVELTYVIPVAENYINLLGAIFAQTSATAIELVLQWANLADLFTLTGNATAAMTGSWRVNGMVFSIPGDGKGGIWVPNLSQFHSLVTTRNVAVQNGGNEFELAGQGVGRQLARLFFRTMTGAAPAQAALAMSDANYQGIYWRFGSNDTPETWTGGRDLRYENERLYNADIGAVWGFGAIDFANQFAFRDVVDEGAASQLRFGYTIPTGVGLTAPYVEYTQETVIQAGQGA